jgi:hypothetical protein
VRQQSLPLLLFTPFTNVTILRIANIHLTAYAPRGIIHAEMGG